MNRTNDQQKFAAATHEAPVAEPHRWRPVLARGMAMALVAFATIAQAGTPALASASAPVAGTDYTVLAKPLQVTPGDDIEVVQLFSYACGACAKFDPAMRAWRDKQPRDVRFQYVPAVFGGAFDAAARAYYTAVQLGVAENTHAAIYRAVHVDQTLTGDSLDQISDAYARLGVDRARFRAVYQSPQIDERLRWAKAYTLDSGIESTPSLIVAGKYRISPKQSGSPERMLATVDYLVERERRARAKH
ncbi:thiol:disulfide interchange protein DsbA/DsbL [Xanthomonas sacchari]|uniref:thiol:disulfide interchange protein DsbA/DsbL n=1 Tax=Xanthomonas sacchari TaxID=56458 RepID=UPI001427D5FE|nr:thiol:disulfide interchange protein DsbA/DsbL [Xanthomonas sacchari]